MEEAETTAIVTVNEIMVLYKQIFSDWKLRSWQILQQGRERMPKCLDIVREREVQRWRIIKIDESGVPEKYRCRFSQNKFTIPVYGKLKNGFIGLGGVAFARPKEYLLIAIDSEGNDVELGKIGRDTVYKVDHVGEDKLKQLYIRDGDICILKGQEWLAVEMTEDTWLKGDVVKTPIYNGRYFVRKVFMPKGSKLMFSKEGFLASVENQLDFESKYKTVFERAPEVEACSLHTFAVPKSATV